MDKVEFGKYFLNLRKKSGYKSQRQLSTISGVNNATIARIENGSQRAKPETLKILSKYLNGVSYSDLMEKSGYLDNHSYQKHEDLLAKYDFMELTEELAENMIRSMTINNTFPPNVIKMLKEAAKELNIDEESVKEPEHLIHLFNKSTDMNFKVELYEALVAVYGSLDKEQIDNTNPNDNLPHNKDNQINDELYEIVHFVKNGLNESKDYEIVDKRVLKGRPAFALLADDNSMQNEGIKMGDTVICVKEKFINYSGILVISDETDHLLLRKVRYYDDFCMLIPSNPKMEPETVNADTIQIIGKVVQSIKHFK
ncbi:hypothetical protein GCM10011391_38790 [Pullulanibacillus camelliae]|uniref:HTH cro/C1-type domain-containing protein n=1 Tax=Pullulanibacillus camelliae TaxID=1707096 RepID=A0A8J2YPA7_9BACL|nr:XRE family transcriptional regulator [Pullulanibacillus camelliae]GGE56033.1 hypothetical protein GCM10011391_38790 [Pullulanibacillus camelliae]